MQITIYMVLFQIEADKLNDKKTPIYAVYRYGNKDQSEL